MPPPPHQEPVTLDPTSTAFVDGLSCTACGDDVIVYGGSAADRVWRLHLPSATWTEIPCVGMVPPPRFFHAAAHCNGYLSMCGGELITSGTYSHPERVNYYELNLETFEWACLDTFDDVPANRSHHTMTSLRGGKEIIVFGGKPIPAGVLQGTTVANRVLTSRQFHEVRGQGFFDVFILYPMSRTWKRVEMFDPLSPVIWGHSASLYNTTHILFFGGCDVAQADWRSVGATNATSSSGAYYTSDEPPVASLSSTVHILTVDTWQWQQYEMPPKDAGPVPRALHVAECCSDELMMFGGFTINRFGGVVTAADCWLWSVRRGTWQRMEFCVPQWSSKKLLSCVYGTQWIIMPSLDTVFFMEMTKVHLGWQRATSKVQKLLAAPSDRAGMVRRGLPNSNNSGGLFPPHLYVASPMKSLDPDETPFTYKPKAQVMSSAVGNEPSADDVLDFISSLRDEVLHLREELQFTASVAETTHTVEFSRPLTDASRNSKLMRWSSYPAQIKSSSVEDLTMETRGSPTLGGKGGRQRLNSPTLPLHGVPKPQPTPAGSKSANKSPEVSVRRPAVSTPKTDVNNARSPSPAEDYEALNEGESSSIASTPSEAAAAFQPRFVDRGVMDKAAKRKLEVFRRLQAKAERNVRETEHALKMFGKMDQATAGTVRSGNDATGGSAARAISPRPVRETPASSDSEENEDIHRAAELGLQLHRAMMNNTESRRQYLFRERKRRIEQLQDRLRTLESTAEGGGHHHHHHHRSVSGGAGGSGGGSPDVKAVVGMAMRHSEAIQRMMEAHDLGELYEEDYGGAPNKLSANTSVAVMVPNTHAPQSLRSSSFSSLSPSEMSGPAPVSSAMLLGGEFDGQRVEPAKDSMHIVNAAMEPVGVTAHPEIVIVGAHPPAITRKDSVVSELSRASRQDSLPSSTHNHTRPFEASPLEQPHESATGGDGPQSSMQSTSEAAAVTADQPPAVFRGFQRQRAKKSSGASTAADGHDAAPAERTAGPMGHEAQSGGLAAEYPALPLAPPPAAAPPAAAAPSSSSLQTQWDVLQAALLSRGPAPRRVYTASEKI